MARKRSLIRRMLSRFVREGSFARDEKAAVAIEFAILALPFFTLIFAILETAVVFLAGQILDSAVQDAGRKIRTGQAQAAFWGPDEFREEVCDGLYGMFSCTADDLLVRVSTVSTFGDAEIVSPLDDECMPDGEEEDCEWAVEPVYTAGLGSEIVSVQVFYKWPTIVNLPYFNLATRAGNTRLLSAVRVFRNEPF